MKFKPLGCLFAIVISILDIFINLVRLLTWGKLGRMWPVHLLMWSIKSKFTIIYEDTENEDHSI